MSFINKHKYSLAAFFLPFAVMVGVLIGGKCAPFGKNSLMIVDALHQYLPFFADYQQKLKHLDSLFYSWNGGLGYNFFSLWAYYLSSPFNLVIALIPKAWMFATLNIIISIKFSLCSLTAYAFFTHRQGKGSFKNLAFGLCYAFSSYMTGYYWNVMWLEVMILLPIVLLGMDELMKKKKGKIYCLALFGAMFGNYYMSFMVCIFAALFYFTYEFAGVKDFFQKGIRFAGYSILGAAMAAVVLIPAYLGLMNTSSATLEFPEWKTYGEGWNLFATHMAGVEQYNMSVNDGLGNLYCGILPLLLLVLYIIDIKTDWKQKIKKMVLLAFLAVSFQVQILNYVWHGFHNQYGIPNRFAFLYIFLLLIMAYDQLEAMELKQAKQWKVLLAMTVLLAGVILCYEKGVFESNLPYLITIGLIVLYGTIFMLNKRWGMNLLLTCLVIEMSVSGIYGMSCSGSVDCDYYFGETKQISQIVEKEQPSIENRMELLTAKMLDESIWHTLPNATMFGSTALGNTVDAMDDLGFYTGVNEYLYEGGTPITDMLLGMKSILVRNGDRMFRTGYEYLYSKDDVSLYQNSLPTSIGYFMSKDAKKWDYTTEDPFAVQNDLMKKAYGVGTIFKEQEIDRPISFDCNVTEQGNGSYYIETEKSQADNLTFIFNAEKEEDLYLHFDCGFVKNTDICINGVSQQYGRLNSQIVSVGHVEAGDTVAVKLELEEKGTGMVTMRAATIDKAQLSKAISYMKNGRIQMNSYDSTKIDGSIDVKEDGMIWFSIPYDKGWSVKVDGEKVTTYAMAKGLLAIDVAKGVHDVKLQYTPPGFYMGAAISVVGFLVFFLLCIGERSCKKRFRKKSEMRKMDVL